MSWKVFFSTLFIALVVVLLGFYWFIPTKSLEFVFSSPKNSNFTLNSSSSEGMQFYENMRFPEPRISYRIDNCPLAKKDEMLRAFDFIEEKTALSFYSVGSGEEIYVTCDSEAKVQKGNLFVAGEGGPTNITQAGSLNVIFAGAITLLRETKCENPNIGVHELLHVLGFEHSENPNNIMYPVSKCSQTIGEDTIDLINTLYEIPSLPDLAFESASSTKKATYLNVNMTLRNQGLKPSEAATVKVYENEKEIESYDLDGLSVGHGRIIYLSNIFSLQKNVEEVKIAIIYNGQELDKGNNEIVLKIKSE